MHKKEGGQEKLSCSGDGCLEEATAIAARNLEAAKAKIETSRAANTAVSNGECEGDCDDNKNALATKGTPEDEIQGSSWTNQSYYIYLLPERN